MRRFFTILVLLTLFVAIGAALFTWYWKVLQWQESTDNAYLVGNLVTVSAQTAGTVVWIGAEENDSVTAGDELVRLGGGDDRLLLELRKEQLALAVQDVVALRAQVGRRRAELEERTITRGLAEEEYQRRRRLHARKMLSDEELDAARTRAEETAGALETARHALEEARVRAGDQSLAEHPAVLAAASAVRSAWRTWRKSSVPSPVSGEIARRRVQLGQRIEAGAPLFSIAERHSAWVEANFKETQLRHMRPGQPVRIESDLYGDGFTFSGRVQSIGTGTGAVFALLPPQNATGNWIKIVQRVPVRIALDRGFDPERPLPFGASLHVVVDTHQRGGARLPVEPRAMPARATAVYDQLEQGVDELIAGIIEANGPRSG